MSQTATDFTPLAPGVSRTLPATMGVDTCDIQLTKVQNRGGVALVTLQSATAVEEFNVPFLIERSFGFYVLLELLSLDLDEPGYAPVQTLAAVDADGNFRLMDADEFETALNIMKADILVRRHWDGKVWRDKYNQDAEKAFHRN